MANMTDSSLTFQLGGQQTIHRLGFGAMRITGEGVWGEPRDREQAKKVLQRAVELGVDFIDTADSYGPDVSEQLIGEALSPYKQGLVIATKGGFVRTGPNQWRMLGEPNYLQQQVEMSLRHLRTDHIDLWQLHRIDPKTPVEESLKPIKRFQQQGKIRFVGLSEVSVEQIEQVRKVVEVATVQNEYNLTTRKSEAVLDYCEKNNIGFIPWYPVAAGKLAGEGSKIAAFARDHGATVAQLSLAWLLHRSPVMLPIPGTSSVAHLEENMKATGITLSSDEMQQLEEAAK